MNLRMKIVATLATVPLFCSAQTVAPSSQSSEAPQTTAPASSAPGTSVPPPAAAQPESQTATPAVPNSATPDTVPPAAPSPDAIPAPPPTRKADAPGKEPAASEKPSGNLYVIGPLDVLYIKVWNNGNLTGMVDVQDDGMISMALIGQIKADGLTIEQLKNLLTTKLSEFIQNPEVTVQVTKNNSKMYYIMGQGAGRQGSFPLARRTTISEALTNAGGFSAFANQKHIYLLRKSEKYQKKHMFNFKEVLAGKNIEQDLEVENGDRIVVPE